MAAPRAREPPPPPVIGKAGRLTVFITPPPTPKPFPSPRPSPGKASRSPAPPPSPTPRPPPVQVPPPRFEKAAPRSPGSALGLLQGAVARVQEVHSSLDEYLANLFGLNQSKYQWALNDYYENQGKDYEGSKCSKPKGTY
uniref:Uncharacterized protein n=1 Tax=Ananas comosus var. bracteatus TaxID=296719 RepID=A0A6V7PGQ0_ANACO|nr:unnamed protein product [Ananas comosus var. bracteatus]